LIVVTHFEDQSHTDLGMEFDVAMEKPIARIRGLESDDGIASIWNSNCVLHGGIVQIPLE